MRYSTAISSLFGFLSLATALPQTDNPKLRGNIEKAVRVASDVALSSADVPNCADIDFSLFAPGESAPCHFNATASQATAETDLVSFAISPPYCSNDATEGPQGIDASTLCATIPNGFTLPPAYSSTSCSCESWSIGTAVFAFCNCDPCSSMGDASLSDICFEIYDECWIFQSGYTRGYMVNTAPNGFFMLYGDGDQLGPSPVYTSC